MTKTITAETAIGEILERCPEAAEILLAYGVHCVGCHVSPFEPLGDGFRGHGLGDTEINEAVNWGLKQPLPKREDYLRDVKDKY